MCPHLRLEALRQSLAPEVTKWHKYLQLQADVSARQLQLLNRKEVLLDTKVKIRQKQVRRKVTSDSNQALDQEDTEVYAEHMALEDPGAAFGV